MPVDQEKLAKLAASVRTGGKGSVRRKKKAVHKTATTGDVLSRSILVEGCGDCLYSCRRQASPEYPEAPWCE
jgi:hypothetical protein